MPPPRVTAIKLDHFIQQSGNPVFLLGPDRRITFVNRAWEQLTGHPSETVIGQECRPHGPTRPGDLAGLGASFCPPHEAMEGQPSSTRTLILQGDGELRWRRIEFFPFQNADGTLIGVLGLVREPEAPPQAEESPSNRLRVELLELRERLLTHQGFDSLIGRGPEHQRLLDQVAAAASSQVPVLIIGERGTGKKLVARTIHQRGLRRQAPILPFDCQTLPPKFSSESFSASGEIRSIGRSVWLKGRP